MPLIENTKRIYDKYDTKSYSPGCTTYFQADEQHIFCFIVNNSILKQHEVTVPTIAERLFTKNISHPCIKAHFIGTGLKEFDTWLTRYFKLK